MLSINNQPSISKSKNHHLRHQLTPIMDIFLQCSTKAFLCYLKDYIQFAFILANVNITGNNINKIKDLCRKHKVKELYLFGSVLLDNFQPTSDIDLLVESSGVDLMDYFDNFMNFKQRLELLLDRKVDLVENQAIRNPIFRRSVDRTKQLINRREVA